MGKRSAILLTLLVAGCATKPETPALPSIQEETVPRVPPSTSVQTVRTRSDVASVRRYDDTVIGRQASARRFDDFFNARPKDPVRATGSRSELRVFLHDAKAGPTVKAFLSNLPAGADIRKLTVSFFDTDHEGVKVTDQNALIQRVEAYGLKNIGRVLVVGKTDSTGSSAYNQRLSEMRAVSVSRVLTDAGVARTKIFSAGVGERYPVATNATAAGRAANRSVPSYVYIVDEDE